VTWRSWLPSLFQKASAATRAVVLLTTPGMPVSTPRNYERLSKEGYEAVVTVYACVNEYLKAIGSLQWCLYERHTGQDRELDEHALLTLLSRPNPRQSGVRFFQTFIGYLMISGNAYMERVGPGLGEAQMTKPPRELYTLRPDRMTVIPDPVEMVGGYEYRAGGSVVKFPVAQILHLPLFHPTNDWYGLSPIQVAGRAVDTDNAAATWNANLLHNGARPSGALVVTGNLNDDQFKRLRTMIDTEIKGEHNAGAPLLLEGGMDWKAFGLSPADMDFIESRKMSKSDIAQAYQMPAELIGLKEATFENRKEARRSFYTEAVLPLADVLRDELNSWLTPLFGERLRLDYNRDAIEALQEDRAKLWEGTQKADWLTVNEKRTRTGYDTIGPEGDVVLVPFSMTPLGEAGSTGPAYDQLAAEDQVSGVRRSAKAVTLPENPARERQWKAKVLEFQPIEQRYLAALRTYFNEQRDQVLRKLMQRSRLSSDGPGATKAVDELLFELEDETGRLRKVSKPYFDEALKRGGTAVWVEAGGTGAFGNETPASRVRIERQLRRVRSIVETARTRVSNVIEKALNEPDGAPPVAEIAARIRDTYTKISQGQAYTIARTETARAYSEGRDEGMHQLGIEETEWLSARDEAVRHDPFNHAIDGEQRGRGEDFSNGLRYPHDPSGEAGNTINCRCVALPVIRR